MPHASNEQSNLRQNAFTTAPRSQVRRSPTLVASARTWPAATAFPRPGPEAGKARAKPEAAHRTAVRPRQHPPSAAHTAGMERTAGRRRCVYLMHEKESASFAVSGPVRKPSETLLSISSCHPFFFFSPFIASQIMVGVSIPTNALFRRSIVGEKP